MFFCSLCLFHAQEITQVCVCVSSVFEEVSKNEFYPQMSPSLYSVVLLVPVKSSNICNEALAVV